MKSYGFTLVKWLVVGFLALFLGIQVYHSVYSSYSTESAVYYEDYDGIPITGLIIRDENVITADTAGVMSYTIPEGGRVAKEGIVAEMYASEAAAAAALQAEELEAEIQSLQSLQQYNDPTAADLDLLHTQVQTAFQNLLESTEGGRYDGLANSAEQLISLLNREQIVTGQVTDFSGRIAALEAEKAALGNNLPVQSVSSPYAGYFVSSADGYESVLSTDMIDTLTPDQLNALEPAALPAGNIVGKVVSDYEWYIAANISFSDSLQLAEGDSITLRTSLSSMPDLPVTVKKINKSATGEDVTVVFGCTYMNGELAGIRTHPMTIVLQTYEGLRVNAEAIRIVDGQRGVYMVEGAEAKFVPVNILYSTDSYSICEMSDSGDGLQLYDEIIVKGKDLYDGKAIE